MKEEIVLNEKIKLLEKEIVTLTEKLDAMSKDLKEISDLRSEIKGLKLFFGRKQVELGQRRQSERGVGKDDGTAGIEEYRSE